MPVSSLMKTLRWVVSSALTNRVSYSVNILKQDNTIGHLPHLLLSCSVVTHCEMREIGKAEPEVKYVYGPTLHESSCVIDVDSPGSNLGEACVFAVELALAKAQVLLKLDDTVDGWYSSAVNSIAASIANQMSPGEQGGLGADFAVVLRIRERIVIDEPKLLMNACWATSVDDPGMRPDGDSTELCSICMEGVASGGVSFFLLGCRHPFHQNCIAKWFEKKSTCPMCRSDLRKFVPTGFGIEVTDPGSNSSEV